MLPNILEVERLVSPSSEPHAVAIDGNLVYLSSRDTKRIDVMELGSWTKIEEIVPPGMPWGMTFGPGRLVMTCGETDEDLRRIRSYVPGRGFEDGFIACPDDTGSHLASDNGRVLLGQWYNRKLLVLRDDGSVIRAYDTPHGIAGAAVVDGVAHVLGTDNEDAGEYWITILDLENGAARDVARVPFHARGLAWDGEHFWTNYREADRTVVFTL